MRAAALQLERSHPVSVLLERVAPSPPWAAALPDRCSGKGRMHRADSRYVRVDLNE